MRRQRGMRRGLDVPIGRLIGRAAARPFAAEGAKVVVTARREAALDSLVAGFAVSTGGAAALAGDVQSEDFAKALVALALSRFERLDVAFNNAGTLGEAGPGTGISEHVWNEALSTNLTTAFLGAKHQLPPMLEHKGGSINLHHLRRPRLRLPRAGGVCGEQVGADRPDAGAGRRVWAARHPGERDPARRGRYADVPRHERHGRVAGLHHRAACAERVATPEQLARAVL